MEFTFITKSKPPPIQKPLMRVRKSKEGEVIYLSFNIFAMTFADIVNNLYFSIMSNKKGVLYLSFSSKKNTNRRKLTLNGPRLGTCQFTHFDHKMGSYLLNPTEDITELEGTWYKLTVYKEEPK